jgi:hypothetical protein
MADLKIDQLEKFVQAFLEEYLSDGLGAKSKREIDILVLRLLMKHAGLAEKSNQELSLLLQAPAARIKVLRYEAYLKYPPDAEYVQREFLYLLTKSQFDLDKDRIVFVMEDEYLRQAIQERLKAKGMFADSSFNTELVKIDKSALQAVIEELYGPAIAKDFEAGFIEMQAQVEDKDENPVKAFASTIFDFVLGAAEKLAIDLVKSRLGL